MRRGTSKRVAEPRRVCAVRWVRRRKGRVGILSFAHCSKGLLPNESLHHLTSILQRLPHTSPSARRWGGQDAQEATPMANAVLIALGEQIPLSI